MKKLYILLILSIVLPSGALVLAALIWEYQHYNMTHPPETQEQTTIEDSKS